MSLAKSENQSRSISLTKFWLYLGILAIMIFFLAPILWQILTSVKLNKDISAIPNVYLPREFTLEHYSQLFGSRPYSLYVSRRVIRVLVFGVFTVLFLLLGTPAVYTLTRANLPRKKLISTGILLTTLFVYILLFLGLFEVFEVLGLSKAVKTGLDNNYLVIPYFLLYIFNSALVASISTVLCLVLGSPAAYALTRMNLPGEKLILTGILVITLFPYVLLFLGLLEIVKAVGLGNNYLALIIPYTAINLPLTILVMRSFFQQLPQDLEDAAKIDGYKTWGMLVNILLPMTLPALATTGILTFIFAWNEYIFALTFITEEAKKTIPVATAQLGGASLFDIPYGPIAAATVLGTLPLVILVLVFQRQIVQGLTAGAVKG